jgi:hypothetical protein
MLSDFEFDDDLGEEYEPWDLDDSLTREDGN